MNKFKTILLTAFATLLFNGAAIAEISMGFTLSHYDLTTAAKEDIDSNGTTDETKNVSDKILAGSIFAEYTHQFDKLSITGGIDIIPLAADIDKRSISQSSVKDKSQVAVTGTNSVEAEISNHRTFYLQPGIQMTDSMVIYGTIGIVTADVEGKSNTISSTNITESKDLDGSKLGVGVKYTRDTGTFYKLDYTQTDYDAVSYTTSNNTKGTIDLDSDVVSFSVGRSF